MRNLIPLFAALCIAVSPACLWADTNANAETATEPEKSAGFFAGMLGSVTDATIQMSDKYLDYLARPETAKKLATFQKNYYDSLVELGFDKDQAFILLRDLGNPMLEHTRRRSDD